MELNGLVIKSTGSWHQVLAENNEVYSCKIKGRFRIQGLRTTNPVAVGDRVKIEVDEEQQTGVITELKDRKNYIIRRSVNLSKQVHIIGANLDQAILVVTLAYPPTSLGFIDRFLVTAEAYSIPAVLVFNKIDLYTEQGREMLHDFKEIYEPLGYQCIEVSAQSGENIDQLKELLKDKTTLVSGHSGVGKSTLINALEPSAELRVGDVSDWSEKGKHTTTFAEMIHLSFGGDIIDTPGIKELGIIDIQNDELAHYFPEMRQLLNQCRFDNCRHISEPACEVIKQVEEGKIAYSRYENYLSIYRNEDNRG
ncbi:MAG TPA: ribosome small subunit-dependent GTPase A [Candidatus Sphingobacterium stercoripullorum]|nr:ribosome small subunit-dependent GTPase A [Candidatus Sphingobacterium stercoripullorum]